MNKILFERNEIENLEDLIPIIEKMYEFKFGKNEIEKLNSFDQFCDKIIEKIDLKNSESCSSQQAFYKLRNSFSETGICDKQNLKLETEIEKLIPRKNRRNQIKKIETNIGFQINALSPPTFIEISLIILILISLISIFFNWKFGIGGIVISIIEFKLAKKFGKELNVKTIKDLVEKVTSENYLKIRTEKGTVNKTELKNIITNWVAENAGIEKERLKTATFA